MSSQNSGNSFRKGPFEEIPLQELNKCPQKFTIYINKLSARKSDGCSVICMPKLWSLAAVNSEKSSLFFVLNYLTVLAYTTIIIHLSDGG